MDDITFGPPDDLEFDILLLKASHGLLPVYGVVIETEKVILRRAYESHHPEMMPGGAEIIEGIMRAWQQGQAAQPWLYVKNDQYIVADDYFWLALIEKGRPPSFAAQILGEPLPIGLLQKVGPLSATYVQELFGKL
jgi:hypothetical protein